MLSDRIPSRADIRLIRSLGQKKFREELGLFVAEGEKMVGEALTQKRFPVEAVYRLSDVGEEVMGRLPCPRRAAHPSGGDTGQCPGPSIALRPLPRTGLRPRPGERRHHPALSRLVRHRHRLPLPRLRRPVQPQDRPGHHGLHLPLVQGCTAAGIPVYATALDGEDIRSAAIDTSRALILMGSERDGLSPALMAAATRRLHIPSFASNPDGAAESLNVAIATAVTCYEFRRR